MMKPVPAGENGCVMTEGVWYCRGCDAATLPSGPRQGEGHASRRLGPEDKYCDVFEGDAKLLGAYEVQAGPGGWVIEGHVPSRACPRCERQAIVRLRYGDDFRIVRQGGA